MTTIRIRDVQIVFPFTPYQAQTEYMTKVLETLHASTQGLLESPTGTGKTLCLLCATCAWVLANRPLATRTASGGGGGGGGVMGMPDSGAAKLPMRIVYTSRTHAQLTQVIREFKKTQYADLMEMSILGSREHMCVHNTVSKLTNAQSMNSACAAARADGQCRYYSKIQYMLATPHRLRALSGAVPGGMTHEDDAPHALAGDGRPPVVLAHVHDMEDLGKAGRGLGFCPYFYERATAKEADIVFLPYTYLFDPNIKKQLPFSLEDAILIVDEAHNLPSVLSSTANANLSMLSIAQSIRELSVSIELLRTEVKGGELDREREIQMAIREEAFGVWKLILSRLEDAIETAGTSRGKSVLAARSAIAGGVADSGSLDVPPPPGDQAAQTQELVLAGSCMFDLLRTVDLTVGNWKGGANEGGLGEALNQAISALSSTDSGSPGLTALHQFLTNVLECEGTIEEMDEGCRFVLQQQGPSSNRRNHTRGMLAPASSSWTLGFWSLNATSVMLRAMEGTRALLLTSGTLSPMDHFAAELGIAFHVTLAGQHVIQPHQVLCSVLGTGPSGQSLNGTFAFRNSEGYRLGLGYSIINVARNVPNGFLVFFPSYAALHGALELWRMSGGPGCDATIWGQLSELKSIFVEPLDGGELPLVIQNFQKCAEDDAKGGAILFAVCRGKVSEGVDFSDKHGRCVMIVGIPYANQADLYIRLKRQYLSLTAPRRPKVRGKLFTGDDWYRQEALRSVNQAIGRVIRHKDDYGCVVLADPRYAQLTDALPGWIVTSLHRHESFRETYAATTQFFALWKREARTTRGRMVGEDGEERHGVAATGTQSRHSGDGHVPTSAGSAAAFQAADLANRKAATTPVQRLDPVPCTPSTTTRHMAPSLFTKQTVGVATAPSPATGGRMTSKEFCETVKSQASPEAYDTFRGLLKTLADLVKERSACGAAPIPKDVDDAFRSKFGDFVKESALWFDAVYMAEHERVGMIEQFSEFFPPSLRSAYLHMIRKRLRPNAVA